MHLPRYTARLSIVLASAVVIVSVIYRQYIQEKNIRNIQNSIETQELNESPRNNEFETSAKTFSLCEKFYKTVCRGQDVVSDPTGSVQPDVKGEVEALRLYEKIIHEHPDWSHEQIDEELVKIIYTPKRKQMLIEIYRWVQSRMINLIAQQPPHVFPGRAKQNLINRIKTVTFEIPPPASLYANEPDLFTKNDVYYESLSKDRRIIRVGGAYLLSAKSWFNRVFTIAHEMAHSIDPCELKSELNELPGYKKLIDCLGDAKVLSAVQITNSCSKNYFMGEVFADWMSTQIAAEALVSYSKQFKDFEQVSNSVINSVKDLCHQESGLVQESDSHPKPKVRIEYVFGAHPTIRTLLGCPRLEQTNFYCGFEGKR